MWRNISAKPVHLSASSRRSVMRTRGASPQSRHARRRASGSFLASGDAAMQLRFRHPHAAGTQGCTKREVHGRYTGSASTKSSSLISSISTCARSLNRALPRPADRICREDLSPAMLDLLSYSSSRGPVAKAGLVSYSQTPDQPRYLSGNQPRSTQSRKFQPSCASVPVL
jgi:hypothetical protein